MESVESCDHPLHPSEGDTFKASEVRACIQEVIDKKLIDKREFDPYKEVWRSWATEWADEIKEHVMKTCSLPRYKLISKVLLAKNTGHALQMASKSLCDSSTDDFASYEFETPGFTGSALVYGLYFE